MNECVVGMDAKLYITHSLPKNWYTTPFLVVSRMMFSNLKETAWLLGRYYPYGLGCYANPLLLRHN